MALATTIGGGEDLGMATDLDGTDGIDGITAGDGTIGDGITAGAGMLAGAGTPVGAGEASTIRSGVLVFMVAFTVIGIMEEVWPSILDAGEV